MRSRVNAVVAGLLVLALMGAAQAVPFEAGLGAPPGFSPRERSGTAPTTPYLGQQGQTGGFVLGEMEYRYVTSDVAGSHTTTPGVPAFGVNVDGVVSVWVPVTDGWWLGSGALISDTHILTAGHLEPTAGSDVQFQPVGGDVWITAQAGKVHPCYLPDWLSWTTFETGFDIAVVTLDSAAPAGVPRYELYTGAGEVGVDSVKAGYGGTGHGSTGATTWDYLKRAGLNRYDATGEAGLSFFYGPNLFQPGAYLSYDFDSGLPQNDAYALAGIPDLGYGPDEVNSAGGDSGGPTFVLDGGVYKIAGVTSWGVGFGGLPDANPPTNSSWGELSADSRVASYTNFIQSVVSGIPMDGGFKDQYSPGLWVDYDDADGFVDWSEAPYRLRLYGGDNWSGLEGWTETGITVQLDGTVSFDWNYGTLDYYGYDAFGYWLNEDLYTLTAGLYWDGVSNYGLFGSESIPVNAGDEFGFWMYTADGAFGAGVANVYNFSAPTAVIPEPTTLTALSLLGLCSAAVRRRRRRKNAA